MRQLGDRTHTVTRGVSGDGHATTTEERFVNMDEAQRADFEQEWSARRGGVLALPLAAHQHQQQMGWRDWLPWRWRST